MEKHLQHCLDWAREARTGIGEAVFAEGKTPEQIIEIISATLDVGKSLFVTRLSPEPAAQIAAAFPEGFKYEQLSHTAIIGQNAPAQEKTDNIVIVAAGTSDMRVAKEAAETLRYYGFQPTIVADVGVAGLWRLLDRIEDIRQARVVIAVAGMEGALFSVLAGLISAPVIAVPTSVGYGVSRDGNAALSSALASCAPGIVTVNVDNGFGAAVASIKILQTGREMADR